MSATRWGREHRFGKIVFDPARNPAVLDTLTWDADSFIGRATSLGRVFWDKISAAAKQRRTIEPSPGLIPHESSIGMIGNSSFILAEADDGQHALVEFSTNAGGVMLVEPLLQMALSHGGWVLFHEANSRNIHAIYSKASPRKIPQALQITPRIGIGTRMSKAQWPGIWQAAGESSFSVNGIQNSQRELNLLEDILKANLPPKLYYPGIGFVPEGHTGSTFEGLWLCGVAEALKAGINQGYGADADHIMVKRGPDGLERARKVLAAARYYSFFTIDISDVLDYSAFRGGAPGSDPSEIFSRCIPQEKVRNEVLSYYKNPLRGGGQTIKLSEADLARLIGKYWRGLEAVHTLVVFLESIREQEPFDLELSIDEHPPEIHAFDCLTSEIEVAFILAEMKRRGLPLTHLAPNLGVEKHVDYRYHDGLEGLERRTQVLHSLAHDHGVLIDCHSGDDLSSRTRRALHRATGGLIHFKVSPCLQSLFGEVLHDFDRNLFSMWWNDTLDFAKDNAREGSTLASDCIREFESAPGSKPDPKARLFRLYGYATVGKRDAQGNFLYREKFYSLPRQFYAEYTRRVRSYLHTLAADLFE
jgi:hypothetical protein